MVTSVLSFLRPLSAMLDSSSLAPAPMQGSPSLFERHSFRLAQNQSEQFLEKYPEVLESPAALVLMGESYYYSSEDGLSFKAYSRYQREFLPHASSRMSFLQQGEIYFRQNNIEAAIHSFQRSGSAWQTDELALESKFWLAL